MRFIRTATSATGGGSTRLPLISIARRAIRVRSYRRHTTVVRAPRNAPTATPLVRRRLVVEMNGANGSWRWYGRIKRGRRPKAMVVRAPSVTTATPLVRRRLVQTPVANKRALFTGRVFRRKRARFVSRAPGTFLARAPVVQTANGRGRARVVARWFKRRGRIVARAPMPLFKGPRQLPATVSRAGVRAAVRVRLYKQRHPRLARGVSSPTPTPLVRKRLVAVQSRRAGIRGRWAKPRARLLSRNRPAPTVAAVRPWIVVSHRSRLRVRHARGNILRSAVQAVRPRAANVSAPRKARRVRWTGRNRSRVLRPLVAPLQGRAPLAVVCQPRRFRRNRRLAVRALSIPAPATRTTAKLLVVRNRRAATRRSFYARHRMRLSTSTLGTSFPVVFVTSAFDSPHPDESTAGTPTMTAFDSPTPRL